MTSNTMNSTQMILFILVLAVLLGWTIMNWGKDKEAYGRDIEADAVIRKMEGSTAVVEFRNEKGWMCEASAKLDENEEYHVGEHIRIRFRPGTYDRVKFARSLKGKKENTV